MSTWDMISVGSAPSPGQAKRSAIPAGAIRLGQALEPYAPLWFEEPVPPDNPLEFAHVARAVRIPIATGERLTTKAEFATLLRTGGAQILQPALGRCCGIL